MEIIQYPDPRLALMADEVDIFDYKALKEVQKALVEMKQECHKLLGAGLAAPQVGIAKRFFILSDGRGTFTEYINPIVEPIEEKGKVTIHEGCLSVEHGKKSVSVVRWRAVRVSAFNRNGICSTRYMTGGLAIAVQHENDHLNGIVIGQEEKS